MIIGDSIELSTKIGVGAYGSVFIGVDKNTGKEYAVKKIAKDLLLKPFGKIAKGLLAIPTFLVGGAFKAVTGLGGLLKRKQIRKVHRGYE